MKILYTFILSALCALTIYAQPTDNAADPPARDAADVIGIYGDTYANIADINYDPNWGQSGHMLVNPAFDPGTGATILAYPTFNYQGTGFEGNAQDATSMEFLHVDIWVAAGTDRMVKVSPIDNSGNGSGEVLVEVPLTPGAWNSVDLPKSAFGDMSWNSVFQMKFDGQFNGDGSANTDPFDVYLDNIYFWRNPVMSGGDATLSDLQIDGATIEGFGSGITNYNINLPPGTMDVPQITGATTTDPNATSTITQAGGIPGDATVDVTSANGMTMQTYTVSFAIGGPASGAPDPTAAAGDVISLFSDVYTDVPVDTWNTEWSDATFEDTDVAGNPTKLYTNLGFNGIETIGTPVDASEMEFLNMDIWSPNMNEIKIKLVDFLGDGFDGPNGDTEAELGVAVNQGEWQTITIALADFTAAGMSAVSDLSQYIISSDPFGTGTVYIDNVYFSKMSSSAEDVEETVKVTVYPNPANLDGTLYLSESAKTIEILSLQGQLMRRSSASSIELRDIAAGSYIVRITTKDNEQQISKIVIQ